MGSDNLLKGRYFHSFNEAGEIEWQGVVIGRPEPGYYLVQLFEWIMGAASCSKVVSLEQMRSWNFYETAEDMNWHYENRPGHGRR